MVVKLLEHLLFRLHFDNFLKSQLLFYLQLDQSHLKYALNEVYRFRHTDHLLGVVWMVRFIATRMLNGTYEGDLNIYCHDQLTSTIDTFCRLTLQGKFYRLIGDRIHLIPVHDGETLSILD